MIPAYVAKNTTNMTSAIALITLVVTVVSPNHRMNSGTSVTRGIELSSTSSGSNTAPKNRFEASTMPSTMPMTEPNTRPSSVSFIVTYTSLTT